MYGFAHELKFMGINIFTHIVHVGLSHIMITY